MPVARPLGFDFSAGDHGADDWEVVSFDWDEELSGGSRGTVALETKSSDAITSDSLLGKTAHLIIRMGEGGAEGSAKRDVHGVVLAVTSACFPTKLGASR
jgi:hypothetical protein